jgi:hypothetical protein
MVDEHEKHELPNHSEGFGTLPNDSEGFRNVPKASERKEYCTLTVREAARMFEAAGVARTERSIINWCQPNKTGVCRLENYFDPNDRKYFISPQSVELAIQEEKAKAIRTPDSPEGVGRIPKDSEAFGNVPKGSERSPSTAGEMADEDKGRVRELEKEVIDLKITNRGKDYFIEQLQKEREGFAEERKGYVDELMKSQKQVGELEAKLLQLGAPDVQKHLGPAGEGSL